jgi:FixJ family two-component response regulator
MMQCYEELKAIYKRRQLQGEVSGRLRKLIAANLGISDSQVKKIENIRTTPCLK